MNLSTVIFFAAVMIGTLSITYSAAKRMVNPQDFYAAGHRLTGLQNGFAIAGDYMSAASFLGITGAIAIYGYDGFLYSIGFLVSYLVMMYWVAEPMHNLGRYTIADAIAFRFDSNWLRGTMALNTLTITIFYMIAQLVGAGALIHLLLDLPYTHAVMLVGGLMTIFVLFGGMVATSWVQIIKSVMLLGSTLLVSLIVLSRFDWDIAQMFDQMRLVTPLGERYLHPGNQYVNPLDTLSQHLALILGTAGLPHILVRFFTVKNMVETRKSVFSATWIVGSFYLMTIFLGFGASAFVGWETIQATDSGGNLAVPLLAHALGGDFLMAYISAVAFATILAVVTGLVMSASSAFAHDLYSTVLRKGEATEKEQILAAKCSSLGVGVISILLAIGLPNMNVALLVGLTFAVAASTNLPLILLTLHWRRFTTTGALAGIITGLGSALLLVLLGPHVMHPDTGWIRAEPVFPLGNPAIISIPVGFLGAWLGSYMQRPEEGALKFMATVWRAHLGTDKEGA